MASIYKKNGKGSYIIAYFDYTGHRREKSSRTTDHATAARIANKLEASVALRREGIIDVKTDQYSQAQRQFLAGHLDDFYAGLVAKCVTKAHADLVKSRAKKLVELANAERLSDLTLSTIQTAIGTVREQGASLQTCHHYVRAIKQFTRWLARDGRVATDPFAHLTGFSADADRRRSRRAFSDSELARLIGMAESGPMILGINGPDRAICYRLATGTGFRAGELRSLRPENFDLSADPPTITVAAGYSKRRHRDTQPIRRDLAELLRPWLVDKPRGEPVLPLPRRTARMMRVDLNRARAAWIREGKGNKERRARKKSDFLRAVDQDGQVCDFHALRHTFISRLVSSGASVKVAQELARHSTPTLTIGRYAHARLHDLTQALDNLPEVGGASGPRDVVAMRATGTHDVRPFGDTIELKYPQQNPQQSRCVPRLRSARGREAIGNDPEVSKTMQVAASAKDSDNVRSNSEDCEIAPGRIRTCDPRFRKPVLYPTELRAHQIHFKGAVVRTDRPHDSAVPTGTKGIPDGFSFRRKRSRLAMQGQLGGCHVRRIGLSVRPGAIKSERELQSIRPADSSLVSEVPSIQRRFGFEEQDVRFFISDGKVFDTVRDDDEFAFLNGYFPVAKAHPQTPLHNEEQFILHFVVVPDKLPLYLDQLHERVVQLTNHFGFPMVVE